MQKAKSACLSARIKGGDVRHSCLFSCTIKSRYELYVYSAKHVDFYRSGCLGNRLEGDGTLESSEKQSDWMVCRTIYPKHCRYLTYRVSRIF